MRWVALLRGINVGGRSKVPMAPLRELCEELGLTGVRTYIASGNVLFESPTRSRSRLCAQIEQAVAERFGVPVAVVLRRPAELRALVAGHPFGADSGRTYVAFLAAKPAPAAVAALGRVECGAERFEVAGADVYLHYPDGYARVRLSGALLERHLGAATVRNWRTVAKLAELAQMG
jgi:uncharacterized protein (DUF1697 family)